jgi:foldase protein PrsA
LPRRKRQAKIPTPAWERDHSAIGSRVLSRSPQFYAMAAIIGLVVVAVGIIGYAVISDEISDRNRPGSTAVAVGDREFSLEYFTDRVDSYVQQNGGNQQITIQNGGANQAIAAVQQEIVEEQVLVSQAGELGLAATEDEILDEIAQRMGINKEDPTFSTSFQEELTRSGMTEEQFREVATAAVLRTKVVEKYTAEVPASAESVHYRQILVATQAEADDLRAQLEAGGDFAALAKQMSLDTQTKENGGDAGWVPRGVLDKSIEDHLFAQEINKVTTYPTESTIYVYQVIEKAPDRPVEEAQKTALAQTKYGTWFQEKSEALEIETFDAENVDNVTYVYKRVWPEEAALAGL